MKSILDPTFVYVPAAHTDIRKTFARIRAAREAEHKALTERKTAFERKAVESKEAALRG